MDGGGGSFPEDARAKSNKPNKPDKRHMQIEDKAKADPEEEVGFLPVPQRQGS
jgi:hypothetical protein